MGPLIFSATISGPPVPKGRPRARVVPGKGGKGAIATMYTPKETRKWEIHAASVLASAYGRDRLDEPISVIVRAVHIRPKRLLRQKDPDGRVWHDKKPDVDNVAKSALDALELAGIVVDDARIVELRAEDYYAGKTEMPCVEVEVFRAGPCLSGPIAPEVPF